MATTTIEYGPALGRRYVNLTSWAGSLAFSVTPVAGDQLEGSTALSINADGTYSGPAGTYTFHLLAQSGNVYTAAATIEETDTTPPTLLNALIVSTTANSITASVETDDQSGTLYAYISQNSSESDSTIKASGQSVSPNATTEEFTFTGLAEVTGYYVHFVQDDPAGNTSNILRTPQGFTESSDESATATIAFVPPTGYGYTTLAPGFDPYIFEEWPTGEPAAGWQLVFNESEYTIDSQGNLESDNFGVFDLWAIDLNGIVYYETVDTTGLNSTGGDQVVSVGVPVAGTYGNTAGDKLSFTVNYTLAITVAGTPRIPIDIGGTTKYASYVSGSGTTALLFEYGIEAGLQDLDGISISNLELNGGSLTDSNGDQAGTYLYSVGDLSGVLVDSKAPVGTVNAQTTNQTQPAISGTVDDPNASISVSPGSVAATNNGDGTWSLAAGLISVLNSGLNTVTATFTDQAGNVGSASNIIEVNISAITVTANNLSTEDETPTVTGTVTLTPAVVKVTAQGNEYQAALSGNDWSAEITAPLPLGATTITVEATASNGTTDSTTATITIEDTSVPTILSVTPPTAGLYVAGNTMAYTVQFSEPVTVTGVPRIPVPLGGNTRHFGYVSGSGSNTLRFEYTVVVGDNDENGFAASGVELNGGTIRDSAGNAAVLSFNSVETSGVVVDTEAAVIAVNDQTTLNQSPVITGTSNEQNVSLTLQVGGAQYNPTVTSAGTWSQQIGSLPVGTYGMTLNGVDVAGNVSVQATGTLEIEAQEAVSDPNEPDRLSNALTLLKRRLGRYTDNPTDLEDFILDELKAAQERLENRTSLPWFLKTRVDNIQTTPGNEKLNLPSNWIRIRDDWEIPVQVLYENQWMKLTVYSYDQLWGNTSAVPGVPIGCALDGRELILGPPPEGIMQVRLGYYKKEYVLERGKVTSNAWLKYAFDLIVAEAGFILATNYLKNQAAASQFATEIQRAEQDLRMTTIAYETSAMESWELNNGH